MKIFALSDLHLSHATPGKAMDRFGPHWADHPRKIERAWRERVREEDVVVVAGDLSWAMRLPEALPDLEFLGRLPGRKVLVRGNHDYWWSSPSKVRAVLPEGVFILQNDALRIGGAAFAGTRLWTDPGMAPLRLPLRPRPGEGEGGRGAAPGMPSAAAPEADPERDEKLFRRELQRLELSLSRLPPEADLALAVVHYPPLSTDGAPTRAARLIEGAGVRFCLFGHLHDVAPGGADALFGTRRGVTYLLTSCDYLEFAPLPVAEL